MQTQQLIQNLFSLLTQMHILKCACSCLSWLCIGVAVRLKDNLVRTTVTVILVLKCALVQSCLVISEQVTTFSPKIKQIKLFWPQTLKPQQTFKQALVSGWRSNIAEWLEHEHCNKYRPFIYDNIVIIYTSLVGVIIYDEASLKQTEGVVR